MTQFSRLLYSLKIIDGFKELLRTDKRSVSIARVVRDALRCLKRHNPKETARRFVGWRINIFHSLREEFESWNDVVCFHLVQVDAT